MGAVTLWVTDFYFIFRMVKTDEAEVYWLLVFSMGQAPTKHYISHDAAEIIHHKTRPCLLKAHSFQAQQPQFVKK